MKLFHTTAGGVTEVTPRLADVEADVRSLIEAHMETMLGVRFLASEYVIDCVDGGRIDSLGIDENGAPVIVEYKRGTDAGVFSELSHRVGAAKAGLPTASDNGAPAVGCRIVRARNRHHSMSGDSRAVPGGPEIE